MTSPAADLLSVRFASVETVRAAASVTFQRFPLAILCAWTAAALSSWLILTSVRHPLFNAVIFAATLGIPLFVAIALVGERLDERTTAPPWRPRWVLDAVGLAGLVVLALVWPHWSDAVQVRRYIQISVFVHALAAVLPYAVVREPNGFCLVPSIGMLALSIGKRIGAAARDRTEKR